MQLLAGLFIPFLSEEAKEARDEQRFTPACNRNHVWVYVSAENMVSRSPVCIIKMPRHETALNWLDASCVRSSFEKLSGVRRVVTRANKGSIEKYMAYKEEGREK